MTPFKESLFLDYPIPREVSIWEGDGVTLRPLKSLDLLITESVKEMSSDILMTCYYEAHGMVTQMPEGTVSCSSAMLTGNFPFQGNRLLKVTFEKATRKAFLRFYPAIITYQRYLLPEDLDNLTGSKRKYCKTFILIRMAELELASLNPVNMTVDNAQVDFSALKSFIETKTKEFDTLKEEILIYNTVN